MSTPNATEKPNPGPLFDLLTAYQKTAAVNAAIEIDLFTPIGEGSASAADIARRCNASVRGVRILCDYLTICGLLLKSPDGQYSLTPSMVPFLMKQSPAYMGSAVPFLYSSTLVGSFNRLTETIRTGTNAHEAQGTLSPEHEVWVKFARGMGGMMAVPADGLAGMVMVGKTDPIHVLDISASHGMFGLAFAKHNPHARVTGLDWANVLEVTRENAARMGFADRFDTIAGSVFEVPLGGPYDVVLLPNFLHHFDPPTNEKLLRKIHAALKPGGRVATLEFIPNADRVTPPMAAGFSLVMLATTPSGDAYTFAEYEKMFASAGFSRSEHRPMGDAPQSAVISYR